MSILREVIASFGVKVDAHDLEKLEHGIEHVTENLKELGEALLIGLGVEKLVEFVKESAEAAEQLHVASERLGISAQGLLQWQHAAKLNGLAAEQFEASLAFLQRSLAGSVTGNKDAAAAFVKLGVKTKDAHGEIRPMDDILIDVAEGMHHIENPTERAGLAVKLFGRAGARLGPLLEHGADGVRALQEEFEALGGSEAVTEEFVHSGVQLAHNMTKLDAESDNLKRRFSNFLFPAFIKMTTAAVELGKKVMKVVDNSNVFRTALGLVATAMAAATAKAIIMHAAMLGPYVAVIAVFALLGFMVDDLITTFEGGTSVTTEFWDAMGGAGAGIYLVNRLTAAWEDLTFAITEAGQTLSDWYHMGHDEAASRSESRVAAHRRRQEANKTAAENAYGQARAVDPFEYPEGSPEREAAFQRIRDNAARENLQSSPRGRALQASRDNASAFPNQRHIPRTIFTARPAHSVDVPAPRTGRGGGVNIHAPVAITLPAGSDRELPSRVARAVSAHNDRTLRQAGEALSSEAVEE